MSATYAREFPSIYRGVVEDNKDPENLGRCKVRIPFLHGELTYSPSLLPWARQISPFPVNKRKGTFNIPDIGDIVWVFFEGADKNFPIYFGGTYGTEDIKAFDDKVIIYTEDGNSIEYYEGSYKIISGDSSVSVSSGEVLLKNGNSLVTVSPESVTVDSPILHIKGSLDIDGSINSKGQLSVSESLSISKRLNVGEDLYVSGHTVVGNDMSISGCCNRDNGSIFCSCVISNGGDLS